MCFYLWFFELNIRDLTDMINISVQFQTPSEYVFRMSDVLVTLKADRRFPLNLPYSVQLYDSDLTLVGKGLSQPGDKSQRKGLIFRFRLVCKYGTLGQYVWHPGRYFLLLRLGDELTLRYAVQLTDDGLFRLSPGRRCPQGSFCDVLAAMTEDRKGGCWSFLSWAPGRRRVKRWLIERWKLFAVNEARKAAREAPLPLPDKMLFENNDLVPNRRFEALMVKILAGIEGDMDASVLQGSAQELEALMKACPPLRRVWCGALRFRLEPYSETDALRMFFSQMHRLDFKLTPAAVDKVSRLLLRAVRGRRDVRWSGADIKRTLRRRLMPHRSPDAPEDDRLDAISNWGHTVPAEAVPEDLFADLTPPAG